MLGMLVKEYMVTGTWWEIWRYNDPLAAEYLSFMACVDRKDIR